MGTSQLQAKKLSKLTGKEVVEYYASVAKSPSIELLKDKVAVVTGGNRGIGLETCKCLASGGCRVIMGSRNVESGQRALRDEIIGEKIKVTGKYSVPNAAELVKVLPLDLESLASIRSFVEAIAQVTMLLLVVVARVLPAAFFFMAPTSFRPTPKECSK